RGLGARQRGGVAAADENVAEREFEIGGTLLRRGRRRAAGERRGNGLLCRIELLLGYELLGIGGGRLVVERIGGQNSRGREKDGQRQESDGSRHHGPPGPRLAAEGGVCVGCLKRSYLTKCTLFGRRPCPFCTTLTASGGWSTHTLNFVPEVRALASNSSDEVVTRKRLPSPIS